MGLNINDKQLKFYNDYFYKTFFKINLKFKKYFNFKIKHLVNILKF